HVASLYRSGGELAPRPIDHPAHAVLEADAGAGDLEVVELLGVEVGDHARLPLLGEVPGGDRGCLSAVVPPPKTADQRRSLEAGTLHEGDGIHCLSISAGPIAE